MISAESRKRLLDYSRKVLVAATARKQVPDFVPREPEESSRSGAFVTLKRHGQLRGCIGHIIGDAALWQTIRDMTISAALHDPRFASVTAREVDQLRIEISVMSPLQEVNAISELVVGRHGLMIRMGPRSGLLLPQVPVEWKWTLDEFLNNLCLKAGIPPGSHLDNRAKLFSFEAEVFGESGTH